MTTGISPASFTWRAASSASVSTSPICPGVGVGADVGVAVGSPVGVVSGVAVGSPVGVTSGVGVGSAVAIIGVGVGLSSVFWPEPLIKNAKIITTHTRIIAQSKRFNTPYLLVFLPLSI